MRGWLLSCSLLAAVLPAASLAKCPPNQRCEPPARPAPNPPRSPTPGSRPAGGAPQRSFQAPVGPPQRGALQHAPQMFQAPANGNPALARRFAPSAQPSSQAFHGPRPLGGLGAAPSSGPASAPRTFGSQGAFPRPEPQARRFGASAGPAGGERGFHRPETAPAARRFGAVQMQSPAAGREREFGAAAAGPAARHFGASAGVAHASLGERGFGHARGGPRKSPSGRVFVYHGQPHARFAGQRYQWPQGQTYRRFAVGRSLPQTYWLQDYFIEDYADYGLAEPPADYAWIRYGPDLLLINLETGRIDQIVYGAFDEVDQAYLDQPPDDQQPAYAQPDDAGQE